MSWYNCEESHSGQFYHLQKAVLSFCPEYDTSLRIILQCFPNGIGFSKISPDYLLRDALEDNEVSEIRELAALWESTLPSQQEIAAAMIRAVLERRFLD